MSTISSHQRFDARLLMDMVRLQLNWLEREMTALQQVLNADTSQLAPQRSFKSLRGAWAGIVVSEDDFRAACFTLPEDL